MPLINSVEAKVIKDSRNEDTIEVAVTLESGEVGVASVPDGRSVGEYEAKYIKPQDAVSVISDVLAPALVGMESGLQSQIDAKMQNLDGTPDKSKLGANSILGVSLACARVHATAEKLPLWHHLRTLYGLSGKPTTYPRLYVNLMEGGRHATNGLEFQEYLIIPKNPDPEAALTLATKAYDCVRSFLGQAGREIVLGDEGGFAPTFSTVFEPFDLLKEALTQANLADKFDFGLDAAANNVTLPTPELVEIYKRLSSQYGLIYLEDPFNENDFVDWTDLLSQVKGKTAIVGDDLTVTSVERITMAKNANSIDGIIIKPNQIGSLTETLESVRAVKSYGWKVYVANRSGETSDDFIADLAVAVDADGLKSGSLSQPERLVKYQRLVEISQQK